MPVTITLPNCFKATTAGAAKVRPGTTSAASRLSSRKLLDIATNVGLAKNDSTVKSAINELQHRKHYLRELEAEGLLNQL